MKKYEHYDKDGFFHTWRIVPAFMRNGVRVLHQEQYKDDVWAFNEAIFKNEEEAEKRIERLLSCALKTGQVHSYTVKEVT